MISLTETGGSRPVTLGQIETACNEYELESAALEKQIDNLDADLAEVKRKHMAALKRQAAVVANREAFLRDLVESNPELFKRPRTMIVAGVKIGFTASAGKVEFTDDEENVIRRITRFLEADAANLIRVTREVNKDAVRNLPAADMAKIGCKIEGACDTVLVKRMAGEVEKLINKLITKLTETLVKGE